MNIGLWLLSGVAYFTVSSILVWRRRYDEDWNGGVNYTTGNNVTLFLIWPLFGIAFAIIAPFYGFYKLVACIGDSVEAYNWRKEQRKDDFLGGKK